VPQAIRERRVCSHLPEPGRVGVHALGRPLALVHIEGDGATQLAGQEDHQLVGAGQAVTGLEAGPEYGTGRRKDEG